jgi:replicative DNA helicase
MTETFIKEDAKIYLESPIIPQVCVVGAEALSESIGNFRTQQINLIVAETGFGKSDLMIDLALKISKQSTVLFFSAEMSREKTMPRFIANKSPNLNKKDVEKLHLEYSEEQDLEVKKSYIQIVQDALHGHSLYMEYTRDLAEIVQSIEKHKTEHNIEFVFIDHLLILNSGFEGSENENMNQILSKFETLGKDNNLCFVLATQFNKQGERGIEHGDRTLGEVAGGRAVSHLVENVMYLHESKDQAKKNEQNWKLGREVTIKILKKRNGTGQTVKFNYKPNKSNFFEFPNQTDK